MKNIINPVDTDDGLFHDGDPTTETEGTIVYARIMNDIQGATIDLQTEMQNVLADAGIKPDPAKENQLLTAIQKIVTDGITTGVKDATTTQKGIVQLSSATDSDSETVAATPKAIKAVKTIADAALPATGNAASATKLQTARKIGGVSFDGTADINLPGVNTAGNQATSGNAGSATKLQTARKIGGVAFDGTADINLPGVNTAGNQATSGNAGSATKLATARKIAGHAFDGTADITISAGDVGAYTKSESDAHYNAKYPAQFRVGARVTYNGSDFGSHVPQGAVNINNYTNGDDRINGVVYAYLQYNLNGNWVNFA
ncbi:tail fiber protein [Enterobacter hormaechei]|nr:tail fiber protein [Enterobacter hormaechei]